LSLGHGALLVTAGRLVRHPESKPLAYVQAFPRSRPLASRSYSVCGHHTASATRGRRAKRPAALASLETAPQFSPPEGTAAWPPRHHGTMARSLVVLRVVLPGHRDDAPKRDGVVLQPCPLPLESTQVLPPLLV
jgi:hypothetical protein